MCIKSKYIEKKDYLFNIDKWNKINNNVLFITGMSGSGKSTLTNDLCKEYNCTKIELDDVETYFMESDDNIKNNILNKIKRNCPEASKFLVYLYINNRHTFNTSSDRTYVMKKFIDWFIEEVKYNNKLYIINGYQIYSICPPEYFKDKPIIIKEINILKSLIRRTSRFIKKKKSNSFSKNNVKKAINIWFGKKYRIANKELKEFVEKIET